MAGTTKVQSNGKFRCTPSVENFKKFRQKVKTIVNCSNYGAKVKAEKLAPIVRGWRNYHRFCKMDGSRNSLFSSKTEPLRYLTRKRNKTATPARKCNTKLNRVIGR